MWQHLRFRRASLPNSSLRLQILLLLPRHEDLLTWSYELASLRRVTPNNRQCPRLSLPDYYRRGWTLTGLPFAGFFVSHLL